MDDEDNRQRDTLLLLFVLFLLFMCLVVLAITCFKMDYLEKAVHQLHAAPYPTLAPTFPLPPPARSELFYPYS